MLSWGRFVAGHARAVLLLGAAVVVAAGVFGLAVFGSLANGGFDTPGSDSATELALEQASFGGYSADVIAIYSSPTMLATDPAFQSAVTSTLAALPTDAIHRVTTMYGAPSPAGLLSGDQHATRVIITLAGTGQDAKSKAFDQVSGRLAAPGLTTDIAGQWAVFANVNHQVSVDIAKAESIAMPIVFLLSLLIFGSVVSALMPTLVGGIAVLGAFAVVHGITFATEVSVFSLNVITLLGMGLAIDYALFVVTRFREELDRQPDTTRPSVNAALATTMATAGRTVLFSGLIVAASLASLLLFPQNFLRSMGYGGVAAVLVAMGAALTLLPAVLALLGPRLELGRMPWRRRAAQRQGGRHADSAHGAWARVGHSVMRRPVAYLVVIVVALVALASPFLSARWGSVDERILPTSASSRVASDLNASAFGGQTATANIVVTSTEQRDLTAYVGQLSAVPGVASVRILDQARVDMQQQTLVQATWLGNTQSTVSQDLVRALRGVDPGSGATALVGGPTAGAVDLITSIGGRLPWMALVVVLVMLVLLFVAFGSLVLPVKAIVMNVVSIGASFGVVTWIFQEGHLSGLLGFTSPGYLDVTQPILMLAILFGLSMDYEVFLLSRIREEWDRSGDNTHAVAAGLQRSGRIITSAALLLAVVIGGFATSGIVFLKMIGVGMLIAVLLDATVVRALLVPATMRLLGTANWWAPAPMARWWRRHGHRELPAGSDHVTHRESQPVPS